MEETKKTVGAISSELIQKAPETTDPIELQRAMTENYYNNLIECAIYFRKTCFTDFYIVVLTKKERLMQNVLRNYFYARHSCPTPDYDQAIYKYDHKKEDITFIWAIPDRQTCHLLKDNAMEVHPEERGLLQFVLEFADGTLFKLAKTLNGETPDSPFIVQ